MFCSFDWQKMIESSVTRRDVVRKKTGSNTRTDLTENNALRERLRTHKVFTKYQSFYLNCHKFSIKSYVVDVY